MATRTVPEVRHNMPFQAGIVSYRGGKSYLAHKLVDLFPPHTRYIEPFFGAGSVFFAKHPAPYEVINDLDRNVTIFFQMLRDQPADLIAQLWATPYSREEFITAIQEADGLSPLEQARAFFVRHNQGFSGSANSSGDWGVGHRAVNNIPEMVSRWQSHLSLLSSTAKRLRNTIIEHQDFAKVIARFATTDTLIYADPPYLPETRTGGNDYHHEMALADHQRLLCVLTITDSMIALSGYDSPLYRDVLAGWDCSTFDVPAHSAGHVGKRKGKASPRRTECLWRNPHAMAGMPQQQRLWEVL